jgi:glutamate dehydrogenase/leucine dehydrogenase
MRACGPKVVGALAHVNVAIRNARRLGTASTLKTPAGAPKTGSATPTGGAKGSIILAGVTRATTITMSMGSS